MATSTLPAQYPWDANFINSLMETYRLDMKDVLDHIPDSIDWKHFVLYGSNELIRAVYMQALYEFIDRVPELRELNPEIMDDIDRMWEINALASTNELDNQPYPDTLDVYINMVNSGSKSVNRTSPFHADNYLDWKNETTIA